ncbi:hypothetical protein [Vreelandella jeotgali]|uniref:hypothetical protein n=1 Tax=Vreelandella jeotgali TaxID=553386 RepID=UPI00034A2A86|nr:hypothetical protein [Halomonas jeotgali]
MDLNDKNLELLLANQFEIDCIQIELKQQKDDDPIIYSGPGSITQKPDGNFHLKLYHSFNDVTKELMPSLGNTMPGKIIRKEEFFSMEAVDISGNTWTADDISVPEGFSIPATGKIVKSKIRNLCCEKYREGVVNKTSTFFFLVIPGKHHIPCNEWEEGKGGGQSLNTCKVNISGIDIEIKDRENCLTVRADDSAGNMSESFKERLIEAISIVFGKLCPVLYSSYSAHNTRTSILRSISSNTPNQRMATPIKHRAPWEVSNFREFIEKYLNSFESEHNLFYGYWHKINRSWQGGIESAALSISTAIEGVTKNYYSEYGFPDDEIVQQANEAKSLIKKLDIGERIKRRIQSSVGQVKSSSPKNALYKLADEGKVDRNLVGAWVSLRNKSAHADNLDEDIGVLQSYIDEVYKCQNLFNVLLLLKIGFDGKYQDLSKDGWSENTLVLDSEKEGQDNA